MAMIAKGMCAALAAFGFGMAVAAGPLDELMPVPRQVAERAGVVSGKALGDELIFPACALRADGDVFLDDMTPAELSAALGVKATPSDNEGAAFIRSVLGVAEQ